MNKMLINATQRDELRVAITHDGLLIDLDIEHAEQQQKQSNIYKGIITSIEPHLDAVFINYGSEKHGFLPVKEISEEYFVTQLEGDISEANIKKLLQEGQEVVVQVEKDERGTKGAALTTYISLAGSYLVLMPNRQKAGGISRRIDGEEREHLKQIMGQLDIPEGMSAIARTAGVGRNQEELQWDMQVLLRYWEAVKQAAVAKKGPYLIHQESDVIIRAIRDYLRQDIEEIIIDEVSAYERAQAYIRQIRPDFLPNLKLYSDHFPLFSRFQVEQQIENAYQHEVQLPAGGSIVIDHTEALVAIDINSARATKGGNIEETAFNTNKEAAQEIARQMRIRDIGGLIVIDFIDMSSNSHQREVENTLRDAMALDRARIQIGRISRFGLLELSRQRIRSALVKTTQNTCKSCSGRGIIRSVESLSLAIIHMLQEHAAKTSEGQLQVQLPIDVATYIMNEKRDILQSIKEHSQLNILLIPNPHIQTPHYDLKLVTNPKASQAASYKLVQIPKPEVNTKHSIKPTENKEPAINQFLSTPGSQAARMAHSKKHHEGVIKRLWGMMFGAEEQKPTPPSKPRTGTSSRTNPGKGQSNASRESTNTRRGNRGGNRSTSQARSGNEPARKNPANKSSKPKTRNPQSRQRTTDKPNPAKKVERPSTTTKPAQQQKPEAPSTSNNVKQAPQQHSEKPETPSTSNNVKQAPQQRSEKKVTPEKPTPTAIKPTEKTPAAPKIIAGQVKTTPPAKVASEPSATVKQEPIKQDTKPVAKKPSTVAKPPLAEIKSPLQDSSDLQQVKTKSTAPAPKSSDMPNKDKKTDE